MVAIGAPFPLPFSPFPPPLRPRSPSRCRSGRTAAAADQGAEGPEQGQAQAVSGPKPSKPTEPIIMAPSAAAPIQPTLAEVPLRPSTVPRTSSGTAASEAMKEGRPSAFSST